MQGFFSKNRDAVTRTILKIGCYVIIVSGIVSLILAVILPIAEQARRDERVYGTATIIRFESVECPGDDGAQKFAIVSHSGGESRLSSFRSSYKVGMTFDGYYYPKEPELFYPEGSDWTSWAIPLSLGLFAIGMGSLILFFEKRGIQFRRYTMDDMDTL